MATRNPGHAGLAEARGDEPHVVTRDVAMNQKKKKVTENNARVSGRRTDKKKTLNHTKLKLVNAGQHGIYDY